MDAVGQRRSVGPARSALVTGWGLPLPFSTGGYARSDGFMLQPLALAPRVLRTL